MFSPKRPTSLLSSRVMRLIKTSQRRLSSTRMLHLHGRGLSGHKALFKWAHLSFGLLTSFQQPPTCRFPFFALLPRRRAFWFFALMLLEVNVSCVQPGLSLV